jgi:ribosome biogenesis GTPase
LTSVEGRVVRTQSGFHFVDTPRGMLTAVLRGKLKKERQETGLVALGDVVRCRMLDEGDVGSGAVEAVIDEILPRQRALSRRAPGPKGAWAQDIIVANLDQLVPVLAVAHPAPNWRMLDRFLALAEMDEIDSTIVLNKADLPADDSVEAAAAVYTGIGYPVLRVSAKTGEGIGELAAALTGRISAVVGPSGVGKSSLLNAVEPGLGLAVGAVSEAVNKGRHTTRVGALLPLAGGGSVADTPGLREIGLWDVDPGELEWAFVEFRAHLNLCKYHNCTHLHEPNCAVRRAVEAGDITVDRYESYARLLADQAAEDERRGW